MRRRRAIALLISINAILLAVLFWVYSTPTYTLTIHNGNDFEVGVIKVTSFQGERIKETGMGILSSGETGSYQFESDEWFEYGPISDLFFYDYTLDPEHVEILRPNDNRSIEIGVNPINFSDDSESD